MDDRDQECIICTLNLVVASASNYLEVAGESAAVATTTELPVSHPCQNNDMRAVAVIKPCNHFLHNHCLREWSQIANTCPFCRQAFNLVEVHDAVGGKIISSYPVKDKKQVATLDPGIWLPEEEEEEENDSCPICNESTNPEALLLCDFCDANYHTYCVGLDEVPHGDWFCMECVDISVLHRPGTVGVNQTGLISRNRVPRTQATLRRTRQRLRNDNWLGPWNQIGHRIHGATGLDIDFSEDEDVTSWRRLNQNSGTEHTERNVWRVRMNIARRQGADWTSPALSPRNPTPVESVEESMAWGDFEKAKEIDTTSPKAKKRKSRLIVASSSASSATNYGEPQPQRKLKRPRTRRVLDQPESSSSVISSSLLDISNGLASESPSDLINMDSNYEPSFLSSLLREVDMASRQGDDRQPLTTNTNTPTPVTSLSLNYSSSIMSPSPLSHSKRDKIPKSSPCRIKSRSISPLPLTSRVEPVFSLVENSPKRVQIPSPKQLSKKSAGTELFHPLPIKEAHVSRSSFHNEHVLAYEDSPSSTVSSARATLSGETKRDISKIVKSALAPHWRSAEINKTQYGCINRDVSRKLYEIFAENSLDGKEIGLCEEIATAEVATALESLKSGG
ncbi:PHD and RING finger domain-containing protein [Golovinomyces cichoracearum]|uniref:PHD and RING finger domain-containing protein n=1 Tax=Golovinomyces cichoracearum TaxID=62708 RepID=A0A420IEQ4_9PEZI|nr:PHD and RING finger domain-containing protein [Golovinomyces cichoracearum]